MIKATEYCKNVFDGTHDSPKPVEKGYRLLTSKNIMSGYLDKTDSYFISEEDYIAINKRSKVYKWDILFSMIGTVGNVCIITDDNIDFAIKNMGVFSCRDEYEAKWLYFYLQSPYIRKINENYLNGAIQKFLPLGRLRELEIVPFDNEKKKIVDLLWSIEEKLRKNNLINNELESMAKTLYDYWFLQFEFPNDEGKPYKSSGGKMVWNEELKREIPEGWEAIKLKNIVKKTNRVYDYNKESKTYDLSIMPSNSISINDTSSSKDFETNLFAVKEGDILFGSIRPYLRKAGIASYDGAVAGTIHCYQVIKESNYNLALFTLTSENMFKYAINNSKGTKMPVITSDDLLEFMLPYNEEIAKKFNNIKIREIIIANIKQSNELASLRDFLLPLLMNGQVKFKDN